MISAEGLIGSFLVIKYNVFPMSFLAIIVLSNYIANIFLHFLFIIKSKQIVIELGLLLLATISSVALTAVVHYVPEVRPSLILIYIPSVIYSATQSLSFGITNIIIIILSFLSLTILETFGLPPYIGDALNIRIMSATWKAAMIFSASFLMALAFLSNYFMEVLRRREKEIQNLADLNRRLYQGSKTTSDQIFKKMKEGLVVVDHNLKIVKYNHAFREVIRHKGDLTNLDIGTLPIVFAPRLKAYIEHLIRDRIKNFRFKAKDQFRHTFDVGITKIKLKEKESGFLVLINRKPLPWGTVFDIITKEPIELALVRLHRAGSDRIMETRVTDERGRFGFIVPKGEYYITVTKSGYTFPAKNPGADYQGGKFSVSSVEEGFIKLNIPIDKN